jgi:hypothetical protein
MKRQSALLLIICSTTSPSFPGHHVVLAAASKANKQNQGVDATRLVQKVGTMPLAMSRPWKHPKSVVYWLRRAVPAELRRLVGKREEKQTLGTKEPAEAKRLHAKALADLEVRWSNLRAGSRQLTEREAHELAAPIYDLWLAKHRDNPSENPWRTDLFESMWHVPKTREVLANLFEED